MSTFLYHTSCPKCGSQDNLAVYKNEDGSISGYCFTPGCGYTFKVREGDEVMYDNTKQEYTNHDTNELLKVEYGDLVKRGISEDICRLMDYGGAYDNEGKICQVATYYRNGKPVAQKLRYPDKSFRWIGKPRGVQLFGQQAFSGNGKRLVITEGEIDALSVAQVFSGKWQVVSIINGADGAYKDIKNNLEWVESFDEIVLGFDNDKYGKQAVEAVVSLLTPGKVKVANWSPYKDANEMLLAEGEQAVRAAIWNAEIYRPDEILSGQELSLDVLMTPLDNKLYDYPYPQLNKILYGLRKRELVLVAAGTGVGKSTFSREVAYKLLTEYKDIKIGYIALEESTVKTALSLIAIDNNVPMGKLFIYRDLITPKQMEQSWNKLLAQDRIFFYDHFGSTDPKNMLNRIRYMALGLGVDFVILDHISMIFAGYGGSNVYQAQANFMNDLRSLIENTGVGVLAIVHLRKSHSKQSHEEGGHIDLDDLKGASDIKQYADGVIVMEKTEGETSNQVQLWVKKNRLMGEVGKADVLKYNSETGRLLPRDLTDFDIEEPSDNETEEFNLDDFSGLEEE